MLFSQNGPPAASHGLYESTSRSITQSDGKRILRGQPQGVGRLEPCQVYQASSQVPRSPRGSVARRRGRIRSFRPFNYRRSDAVVPSRATKRVSQMMQDTAEARWSVNSQHFQTQCCKQRFVPAVAPLACICAGEHLHLMAYQTFLVLVRGLLHLWRGQLT